MKHYGFVEKDVEPSDVYAHLKRFVVENGFQVDTESSRPNFWDLRASKRGTARIVFGTVRDADIVVAGARGKFEVQFKLGVWGKDLAVPAVEGVATLGVATAIDLHEEHVLEDKMWRNLVSMIDPTLQICGLCGAILKSPEDLQAHQQVEAQQAQAQMGMGNPMMMGMFGMGMFGMGMMGPMMWI
ncbi:MAG: hypothetical protein ACREBZ_07945 [Thermoplasmata archaeon]